MKRIFSFAAAAVMLASCGDSPLAPSAPDTAASKEVFSSLRPSLAQSTPIPGRYIVMLKSGADVRAVTENLLVNPSAQVERQYPAGVITGFAATLSEAAAASLRNDPDVVSVTPDLTVNALGGVETGATWGLDRIDQSALPLNGTYSYGPDGSGVYVYIVDTGIYYAHSDFGGRAISGYDAVSATGGAADCHGHGTHVAGTVGGTVYGVAKAATLVGVRVLDCTGNGSSSGVIGGLDYVLAQKQANPSRPMVVNMSLGGGVFAPLDSAVARLTRAGVTVVVAAGNAGTDACTSSPARAAAAITVGATMSNDGWASFSNFGTCVDINAPGYAILSTYIGGVTALGTLSGTSMASPHVAGAAALYLSMNPTATPAQVDAALKANATTNVLSGLPTGTPNRLLNVGFMNVSAPVAAPNTAPSATISAPASGASFVQGTSVTFSGSGADAEDGALNGGSLVWTSNVDGAIGTGASVSTSALTVGTHAITLTVTDSKGLTGTAVRTISITAPVNQAPSAAITAPVDGASVMQGTSVTFSGAGGDPEDGALSGASLVWTSSINGVIGTGANVVSASLSVGTHTITLTATDSKGATATSSRTLTVKANQAPSAAISSPASGSTFVQGASIAFAGTGADPEDGALSGGSLVWTSSVNGQIGTGASVATASLSVGTHTITLTATDSKGLTATAVRTISVTAKPNTPPTASITAPASGASFVVGTAVTFAGAGADAEDGQLGGAKLVWASDVDGQFGTGASVTVSTLSVGTHTVTLTATDSKGAIATSSRTVVITAPPNQAPSATIVSPVSGSTFVQGTTVVFVGLSVDAEDGALGGASLVWTSSIDGTIGTGLSASTSGLSVGTHTITLTATDSKGATATAVRTISVTAKPNTPPTATISAPGSGASFVRGAVVTFTGAGADAEDGALNGASLVWTSSVSGTIGTGASFSTSALPVGTHTITLTATDSKGATAIAVRTISVVEPPNVAPTASISAPVEGSTVTQGASVTFTGGAADPEDGPLSGASLVWTSNLGGRIGTGASVTTSGLAVGTHTITLTATDSKGATATATRTITVRANQAPTASISAPASGSSFVSGATITFTGSGADLEDGALSGASLVWSSNVDGRIGTGATVSTDNLSVGTHTITLTVTDSKGLTGAAVRTIAVTAPANQAPTANITGPTGTSFVKGATITFTGTGTDPEDGSLSGASLVWTSNRDGQIGTGSSVSTGALSMGAHTITLTATDSKGATSTETLKINVVANKAPVGNFVVNCSVGAAESSVESVSRTCEFDASASTDDVGIATYTWTINTDVTTTTSPTMTKTFAKGGFILVWLKVTDGSGLASTSIKQIKVP